MRFISPGSEQLGRIPLAGGAEFVRLQGERDAKAAEALVAQGLVAMGLAQGLVDGLHAVLRKGPGLVVVSGPVGSGKAAVCKALVDLVAKATDERREVLYIPEEPVGVAPGAGLVEHRNALLEGDPGVVVFPQVHEASMGEFALDIARSRRYVFVPTFGRSVLSAFLILTSHLMREPGEALRAVLSQVLLRKLCPRCSVPAPDAAIKELQQRTPAGLDLRSVRVRSESGCEQCSGRGFDGGQLCAELLIPDTKLGRLLQHGNYEVAQAYVNEQNTAILGEGFTIQGEALRHVVRGAVDPADLAYVTFTRFERKRRSFSAKRGARP